MGDVKLAKEVDAFIRRWQGREGGQERANYVSFLKELIWLLDLPSPDPADATHEHNDYVFERAVRTHKDHAAGQKNSFVLEAKQSRLKGVKKVPGQNDLFTADIPEGFGACEHMRSDIMRARKLFPHTNALLTGPQHGVADDALGARSHQRGPLLSERRRKKPKNGGGHPDSSEAGIPNLQEPHTCQMY
jgi:hypothetical protein